MGGRDRGRRVGDTPLFRCSSASFVCARVTSLARHRSRHRWSRRYPVEAIRSARFSDCMVSSLVSTERRVLHTNNRRLPVSRVVAHGRNRNCLVPDMVWHRYLASAGGRR
ncbi:hypothetical protein HCTV-16_gp5 [Haloarcula virus HCTV-16]|nr:hypothetical protein HCTV-16_gp5 [Haloarcula virus HCTV-16]